MLYFSLLTFLRKLKCLKSRMPNLHGHFFNRSFQWQQWHFYSRLLDTFDQIQYTLLSEPEMQNSLWNTAIVSRQYITCMYWRKLNTNYRNNFLSLWNMIMILYKFGRKQWNVFDISAEYSLYDRNFPPLQ